MHIDMMTEYRTRSGSDVRIYATDGVYKSVHGAFRDEKGWHGRTWFSNGRYLDDGNDHKLDLLKKPKRIILPLPQEKK